MNWPLFLRKKHIKKFSFFLLAAFLVLVITKLSKSRNETIHYVIGISDLPDDVLLTRNKFINVESMVKTSGFSAINYNAFTDTIRLPSASFTLAKEKFTWTISEHVLEVQKSLSRNFEIITVTPDTLEYNFHKIFSKKLPISIDAQLDFESGYQLSEKLKISPDSVKVYGSEDLFDGLKSISTVPFKKSKLNRNFEEQLPLKLDIPGSQLGIASVTIKGVVEKHTEKKIEIPIKIINKPTGVSLKLFPSKVELSFWATKEKYLSIDAKDFIVICDYKTIYKGTQNLFMIPQVQKEPKGIKNLKINLKKVDFIIQRK